MNEIKFNKMFNFYCFPVLGRSGLGNKLFPWARTVIHARNNNLEILSPKWGHVPIGPFVRKERTKRLYFGLFTNKGYINGIRKFLILLSSLIINENDYFLEINTPYFQKKLKGKSAVIKFSGLKNYFYDLNNKHSLIKEELIKITHPKWLRVYENYNLKYIAVHVRRGDVVEGAPCYTPIDWFVRVIARLREKDYLKEIPVKVFSDGYTRDLAPLLSLENVQLVHLGSAVADLLVMSKAFILVASGSSTFSMWVSFLGRMHTIYSPTKMQQKLFEDSENIYEGEFDPQKDEFPERLSQGLKLV